MFSSRRIIVSMHPCRGAGYTFGSCVVHKFLETNNMSHILRAHQLCMEGYSSLFDKHLSTVWSAPNYCYRCGNSASILEVGPGGSMYFNVFEAAPENERDGPSHHQAAQNAGAKVGNRYLACSFLGGTFPLDLQGRADTCVSSPNTFYKCTARPSVPPSIPRRAICDHARRPVQIYRLAHHRYLGRVRTLYPCCIMSRLIAPIAPTPRSAPLGPFYRRLDSLVSTWVSSNR